MSISPTAIDRAEQARNSWRLKVPAGTKKEELLEPKYWAHIAAYFHQYDLIEALTDDGTWFGELIIVDVPPKEARIKNWAKVQYLQFVELQKEVAVSSDQFEVKWNVGSRKYRVIRKSDKAMLFESTSQPEAAAWIATFEKKAA